MRSFRHFKPLFATISFDVGFRRKKGTTLHLGNKYNQVKNNT